MRMAKEGRLCKPAAGDWSGMLRQLLPPEVWRAFLEKVPDGGDARRHWSAKYVVLCWALMGWVSLPGLGQRFERSRAVLAALWPSRRQPGRTIQGLMKAGHRRTVEIFLIFWHSLRQRLADRLGSSWTWYGWVVFAVDGSRIDAPRTRANERGLGCAGRAKTGPQWLVTTLIHLPSRLLWSWRQGPGTSSERGHLREMLGEIPPCSLVLADAGFVGFVLMRALLKQGTDFVMRCGGNITLRWPETRQKTAGRGARQRVYLWPTGHRGSLPIELRLIPLQRGGKRIYLLTNILETTRLSARMAGELYAARWGVEVNFRSLKQTLERRRLLARTPHIAALELAGNLLALGLLLAHAAWLLRHRAARASVAAWLHLLRRVMEGLIYGRSTPGFAGQARSALRDEYPRRHSKRARDWPHKKNDPPAGPPKLRRITPEERKALSRLIQQGTTQNG